MKYQVIKLLAVIAISYFICAATIVRAAVIYDEAVNGDAGEDPNSVVLGSLLPGNYQIIGGNPSFDYDYYSFTIGNGFQLDAIMVDSYSGSGLAAIQVPFLGGSTLESTAIGQNFLTLANIPQPVSAGTYLFRTLTGQGVTTYQYSFYVSAVPEPASLALLALAIMPLLTLRRRKVV